MAAILDDGRLPWCLLVVEVGEDSFDTDSSNYTHSNSMWCHHGEELLEVNNGGNSFVYETRLSSGTQS